MLLAATTNPFLQQHREIETALLGGRHQELDRRLAALRSSLVHASALARSTLASTLDEVGAAVTVLGDHLTTHARMQEHALFPAYVASHPCSDALFARFVADAAALKGGADAVRAACANADDAARSIADRLTRFAVDVEEHLADEALMLHDWARAQR